MIVTINDRFFLRYDPAPMLRQARLQLRPVNEDPIGLGQCHQQQGGRTQLASWIAVADHLGVSDRRLMRWLHEGTWLDEHTAERLADRLNLHPVHLWPEWYEDIANDPRRVAVEARRQEARA